MLFWILLHNHGYVMHGSLVNISKYEGHLCLLLSNTTVPCLLVRDSLLVSLATPSIMPKEGPGNMNVSSNNSKVLFQILVHDL